MHQQQPDAAYQEGSIEALLDRIILQNQAMLALMNNHHNELIDVLVDIADALGAALPEDTDDDEEGSEKAFETHPARSRNGDRGASSPSRRRD